MPRRPRAWTSGRLIADEPELRRERSNEPDDEYEYDDENVEPRQRISPAGLWWIIGGSVISVILILLAWSDNRGTPARLLTFSYTSIADPVRPGSRG
jgi:hypothetical protein